MSPIYPHITGISTAKFSSRARSAAARLTVRYARGRVVATLADGRYEAGEHAVRWDGLNTAGEAAGPGVYFVCVETGVQALRRKIVHLK
jgi:flagellar hook assembly protein FlgD